MARGATILVVEPRANVRHALSTCLATAGYLVLHACDAQDACRLRLDEPPHLLITGDISVEPSAMIGALRELRDSYPSVPIVLFLARGSEETAIAALKMGVRDYIRQPDYTEVVECAGLLLGRPEPAEDGFDCLVGRSPAVIRTREYLRKVAASDCNVLVTGETGTGKELVATSIHCQSARKAKRFVAINCAAIPDTLFESELFGFERGAFTGAHARSQGKLEQAHGGSIFLDEIGEMSALAQAKLLRAIESKQIDRLGGNRSLPVDVRIIAATNQALDRLVAQNRFRPDLYFRLAVAQIALPPLRDRVEDIPVLVAHFLRELNRRAGRSLDRLHPDAMSVLMHHAWPGNVRELRNLLEAVAVEHGEGEIGLAALPAWFLQSRHAEIPPLDERRELIAALERTHWNKSRAAQSLNWSRMTLYRKMAKHEVVGGRGAPPHKPMTRSHGAG